MRIQLQGPSHGPSLLAGLDRCRHRRQFCDVFLQVGSRTFAAHRAVLACAGTYFHKLFTQVPATSPAVFSLEFISSANFEKVLTFVYTGGILIDLIDVGVLYELAEKLGICELVSACHATFPDLQESVSAKCKASRVRGLPLDAIVATATAVAAASVSASCIGSSAASRSPPSSGAAAPAVTTAPSALSQTRTAGPDPKVHTASVSLDVKEEDIQCHVSCGQLAEEHRVEGHLPISSTFPSDGDCVRTAAPELQLKIEERLERGEAGGCCASDAGRGERLSELQSSAPVPSDCCSRPEACAPTSPSAGAGMLDVQSGCSLVLAEAEAEREAAEEEQWRQLAAEIIELSDDEHYIQEAEEEEEEEEDEDELECVETDDARAGGNTSSRGSPGILSCKVCSTPVPADAGAILTHGETHLTERGLCRVCGASFPDGSTSVSHSLTHIGVQLFTCDMCHLQFCSQKKLLHHRHQTASAYSVPQRVLSSSSPTLASDLTCDVCTKTLSRDFQTLRDHLLSHVVPQNLTCGVCHLPQQSLCSLLWHTLTHLSLAVYSCPHCALCFVERPLLDRHVMGHAEEATVMERENLTMKAHRIGSHVVGSGGMGGAEEMHCFLCPERFDSSSAFQYHLSLHATESTGNEGVIGGQSWFGKRKADQSLECPLSGCSSSSSPQDIGSIVKVGNLGLGVGMALSIRETFTQRPIHNPSSGVLSNGTSGLEEGAGAAGVRGKWYRCRFCGKRFAHSGEFTYHLRIHTGEKPYQCKVCLRFFRGRSTMICHLKTHAGALMYRCTVCGLYFSTLKLVSTHMELHKDSLPPDFSIEQTFMYNDHSKEPPLAVDT